MATTERGLVALNDLIQDIQTRFEAPAHDKGLTLRVEYPAERLNVWGDQSELDRMIGNLVSNAVKYTLKGEVRLLLERADGAARIVVADTGIGIPEDALPHLFDEFFRANNAKDLQEAGTGLGMSIIKDLVERYDGEIEVQSVEGEGTTLTLNLPLAKTEPI
jgi:signal transduction histidine kinase